MSNVITQKTKQGIKTWDVFIDGLYEKEMFTPEIPPAHLMARNFSHYKGKYIFLPKINFNLTRKDRTGQQYFYYPKPYWEGYVMQYHDAIGHILRDYSCIVGNINGADCEIIGRIEEAFTWWPGIVSLKIVAIRIPGIGAVYIKDEMIEFVD